MNDRRFKKNKRGREAVAKFFWDLMEPFGLIPVYIAE